MFAGNAVYVACQWGLLGILARLGTPETVGQFVFALAISTPVMAFFMLQLRGVQATDARGEFQFGHYLALRLATTCLAILTMAAICTIAGYSGETFLIVVLVGTAAGVDSLSDIVHGSLQQHERLDRIAQSRMLKGLTSLAAMTLTMFITGSLCGGILAMAASRLLVFAAFDLPVAAGVIQAGPDALPAHDAPYANLLPRWEWRQLVALARLSAPLGLVMMLLSLESNIPRYFVESHFDKGSLGIFGAIGYLSVAGTMAVCALGESTSPRLARYYAQGDKAAFGALFLNLATFGAAVGTAGIAVALLAGPQILTILYGPAYARHCDILVWTMVAAAISCLASFFGYANTAARYFRPQVPLRGVVVAVNAAACWWLVPARGLQGAVLALVVSALTQLLGAGAILAHALRTRTEASCPKSIVLEIPERA
jgi:O-antigen/teichoic acid export membrane protein